MLKRHEVEWVRRLAEQGLSRRAISMKTGHARVTVQKILDGLRADDDDETRLFSGPIERCPECGGRVYLPCLACRAQAFRASRLEPNEAARIDSPAREALRRRRRRPSVSESAAEAARRSAPARRRRCA